MSRFVTSSELNFQIEKLINEAETVLVFISPYIKIHDKLKDILRSKTKKENLNLFVVFGKNENDKSKSISIDEIEFLKQFPNFELRYEERLHAKFYANDFSSILTSMNLYDYSFDKNIEFGILAESKILNIVDSIDSDATIYFKKVRENSKLVYKQEAMVKKSMGGFLKSFEGINVVFDELNKAFNIKEQPSQAIICNNIKPQTNERNNYDFNSSQNSNNDFVPGFCIRSGEKIEFNPERPFSFKAYQNWAKFGNEDYPEGYCHFSGEPSNGETSCARPILSKNWRKAQGYLTRF
jgi:hypothetical protein